MLLCTFLNNYIKTFKGKLIFMSLLHYVVLTNELGVDCWVLADWLGWEIWVAAIS